VVCQGKNDVVLELFEKYGIVPEPNSGCWLWMGQISTVGYGQIRVRTKALWRTFGAHRVIYESLIGPIPDGLGLDHKCCVPSCVNPSHLEPVTQAENMRRAAERGRMKIGGAKRAAKFTHCPQGHEYTPENTYYPNKGYSKKVCRACRKAINHRYYWNVTRGKNAARANARGDQANATPA
jgi:hypothetical protein